jgi:hypothetical protein
MISVVEEDTLKGTAQSHFNATYITSAQIIKELKISRAAFLYARRSGKLPGEIVVNDGRLYLWEKEQIQAYLDAWKIILDARRGS